MSHPDSRPTVTKDKKILSALASFNSSVRGGGEWCQSLLRCHSSGPRKKCDHCFHGVILKALVIVDGALHTFWVVDGLNSRWCIVGRLSYTSNGKKGPQKIIIYFELLYILFTLIWIKLCFFTLFSSMISFVFRPSNVCCWMARIYHVQYSLILQVWLMCVLFNVVFDYI